MEDIITDIQYFHGEKYYPEGTEKPDAQDKITLEVARWYVRNIPAFIDLLYKPEIEAAEAQ